MYAGESTLMNARQLLVDHLKLEPDMTYADLGVGTAAHFIFVASDIVGPNGKVYALDIMKSVLEATKSKAKTQGAYNIETVWTDLEVYGAAKAVSDESLDRMSMVNLLFQTTKDEHVFNEADRMLKQGGMCMVVDWKKGDSSGFGPPDRTRTSLDKIRKMAKVVGWKEVELIYPNRYHFGVVFQK